MSDHHSHRSLFLSDLHLGALGCRADLVLRFLRRNRARTYVLAGDILDIWHPVVPLWTATQQAVVDHLAARARQGARLVYVRGNHDPAPDTAPLLRRLPVEAAAEAVHEAADGRRYLVVHGDGADAMLFRSNLLRRFGTHLDTGLRGTDRWLRRLAARADRPERRSAIEWGLSRFNAAMYPRRGHERRLVALARARGLDGVICGHFHLPALHEDHGLVYANCGDWMDSFSAIAEDSAGRLRLLGGRAAMARDPLAGLVPAGA